MCPGGLGNHLGFAASEELCEQRKTVLPYKQRMVRTKCPLMARCVVVGLFGSGLAMVSARAARRQMQPMSRYPKTCWILRISPKEEQTGVDVSEHGMHAYPPAISHGSFQGTSTPVASA